MPNLNPADLNQPRRKKQKTSQELAQALARRQARQAALPLPGSIFPPTSNASSKDLHVGPKTSKAIKGVSKDITDFMNNVSLPGRNSVKDNKTKLNKTLKKENNSIANFGQKHPHSGDQTTIPITPVAHVHMQAAQRVVNGRRGNGGEQFVGHPGNGAGQHESKGDKVGKTDKGKGPKHPLMHRAKETIAAQIGPQLAEYRHQIQQQKATSKSQQGDLTDLYRRLGVQIDASKTAGDTANTAAQQSITGNYDKLLQQVNDTYGGATGATNSELSRLGIQAASPAATAQLESDQKFLTGLAGIDKANAQSNSTGQGQSFDNLIGMLGGQAKLSGTQKKATALQTAADAISELRSQKGALAATRRGAVDALFHQLKDAKTQQQLDAAQQNFMNQIAAGKLGIEQGNLGIAQGKLNLDTAKFGESKKNDVVNRDLKRATALKYIADAKRGGTSSSGTPKGYGAAVAFLSSSKTGKNAAAKEAKSLALDVFKDWYTTYGTTALTQLSSAIKGGHADRFVKLPQDLQGAIIDALTMAGAK